jgi:hypothetical protein
VGLLARVIWFAWLVSLVLLNSRDTDARFHVAFVTGALMLALVPVSGIFGLAAWRRLRWRAFGTPLVSLALFVTGFFISLLWGAAPPAHGKLVARFQAHRGMYETLREMVDADGLGSVLNYGIGDVYAKGPPFSGMHSPEYVGLSSKRASEYRRLMWEADCKRIDRQEDGSVLFAMGGWGFAGKGWRMALLWKETTPEPLLPTIDQFQKTTSRWEEAYSKVDEKWYLRIVW